MMITKPDEVRQLYWTAYQKPALMLTILREAVVGHEEFDRAFSEDFQHSRIIGRPLRKMQRIVIVCLP